MIVQERRQKNVVVRLVEMHRSPARNVADHVEAERAGSSGPGPGRDSTGDQLNVAAKMPGS
jgi:hypothetical protein